MKTILVKQIGREYCLFEGEDRLIGTIKEGKNDSKQKEYLKQYYYIEDYNKKIMISSRISYPKHVFEFSIDPEIENENYQGKVIIKLNKKNLFLGIAVAIILGILLIISYINIIIYTNLLQNEQKLWSIMALPLLFLLPISACYMLLNMNYRILQNKNEIYNIVKKFKTPYKIYRSSDFKEVAKINKSGIFSNKYFIEIKDDVDYLHVLSAFLYIFSKDHLNEGVAIYPYCAF